MATRSVSDNGFVDATTASAIFTTPVGEVAIPQKLVLYNDNSTAEQVRIYVLCASGDTVTTVTKYFEDTIASKETRPINLSSFNLGPSGSVRAVTQTASQVVWHFSATLKSQNPAATGGGAGF